MFTSTQKSISLVPLHKNEAGNMNNSLQETIGEIKHFFSTYERIKNTNLYQTFMSDDKIFFKQT